MSVLYRLGRSLWQKRAHHWLLAVLCGAVVGVATGRTVIAAVSGSVSVVDGLSMAPTYHPGTRVYTAPISTPLERGDIVLVDDGQRDYALKRIIGLPGETIHLWRGRVFINRQMLQEPYLSRFTYTIPNERTETYVFRLEEGQYFVLGDNRVCSIDSRAYGPVERKQIRSRVPLPDNNLRPTFAPYTLPTGGRRTIERLEGP
jgi:signal peptidase I